VGWDGLLSRLCDRCPARWIHCREAVTQPDVAVWAIPPVARVQDFQVKHYRFSASSVVAGTTAILPRVAQALQ
jgi:hypothetical protein